MVMIRARFIFVGVLALVGFLVVPAIFRQTRTPIEGDLSPGEVEQIRGRINRTMLQSVLKQCSWNEPGKSLRLARDLFRTRILLIEKRTDGFVAVFTGYGNDPIVNGFAFWSVFRGPNGWEAGGDGQPLRRPIPSPAR